MRKKQLFEQKTELFNQLENAKISISKLKDELNLRDEEIRKLNKEIENLSARVNATKPLKDLEAKVVRQAVITKDVEYGASAIGRTVVEAAKNCNELTGEASTSNAKELVNLILGRTEVAKAEILKIVSSKISVDEKIPLIDEQCEQAKDYFKSVMAQRN